MFIVVDVWDVYGKKVVEHRRLDFGPQGYTNPYWILVPGYGYQPIPSVNILPGEKDNLCDQLFYHVRSNACEDKALLEKWTALSEYWWAGFTPVTNCWWASRWWLAYGISDPLWTRVDVPPDPPPPPPIKYPPDQKYPARPLY